MIAASGSSGTNVVLRPRASAAKSGRDGAGEMTRPSSPRKLTRYLATAPDVGSGTETTNGDSSPGDSEVTSSSALPLARNAPR